MEARRVHPYPATVFHQFVGIVEATIWRQRDVAVGREHYLYLYTTLDSILERFLEFPIQCEVGVDEFDAVLGTVDGVLVEIPDYIIACARLAIDNAHNLFPPTLRGVWFQPCKVRGVGIVTAIILGCPVVLFHIFRKIRCSVFTSLPSRRQCMSCHEPTFSVPLM